MSQRPNEVTCEFIQMRVVIDRDTGCWIWQGSRFQRGYGRIHSHGRTLMAHRASYEIFRESIPEGLTIDHLCRNVRCVNPEHLEAVTVGVNVLRGFGAPAQFSRRTHCGEGHPLSGDNLQVLRRPFRRRCRHCHNDRARQRYLRRHQGAVS